MARLIGDTRKVGSYLRVCTEVTNDQLYISGFSSLRHADGRELRVYLNELPALIELLQRAQFSTSKPPIKRDAQTNKKLHRKNSRTAYKVTNKE